MTTISMDKARGEVALLVRYRVQQRDGGKWFPRRNCTQKPIKQKSPRGPHLARIDGLFMETFSPHYRD